MPALRKLDIPSHAKVNRAIRGKKYVVPDCKVYSEFDAGNGKTERLPVSGPCKQAPYNADGSVNTNFRSKWWETCTHGAPAQEELDALGYTGPAAYYDKGYRTRYVDEFEKQADGSLIVTGRQEVRQLVIMPRIEQVSASKRNNSGSGPAAAELFGAKKPEEFGIAPFCEYWDCFSQDITKYANGYFCSEGHSKLVFADEEFIVLAIGDGDGARKRRREQLREMTVGR